MNIYLNCPYSKKDFAKQHGALWDAERKQWFFPGSDLPEPLKQFSLAIRTVQRLISELPYLSDKLRARCRKISVLENVRPLLREIAMGLEVAQKKMRVEEAGAAERSVAVVRAMAAVKWAMYEDVRLMVAEKAAWAAEAAWEVERAWEAVVALEKAYLSVFDIAQLRPLR
ncbi:MAG: DUF5710 domain-containing protein [Nitrososphaera sp.]